MKPVKTYLILLLATGLLWSACKKSGSSPQTSISFSFKGRIFTMSNPTATQTPANILLSGKSGTSFVTIAITNAKIGDFDLAQYQAIMDIGTAVVTDSIYQSHSGTLSVIAMDSKQLSGTFNGTMTHYPDTT